MTIRSFVTKSGNTFEWEETEELIEQLAKLHEKENERTEQSD